MMEVDLLRELLTPAINRSRQMTWPDVYDAILSEKVQLWTGEKSAMVTYIYDVPDGKSLCWLLAGGELEEITKGLMPIIEEWAKLEGCTQAEIIGRPGWERVLKDYKNTKEVKLIKEL